ncbi:MAG TPA: hypothetical protein ENJ28_05060 [Gammaproteobacteria bacterium]|nr:hypothetical protein [Gammaproteobacteria bacterium]
MELNKVSDNKNITLDEVQKLADSDEVIMPMGRYRGQSLEDIPNYYLQFIIENDYLQGVYEWLLIPVEKELKYRKDFDIFIDEE